VRFCLWRVNQKLEPGSRVVGVAVRSSDKSSREQEAEQLTASGEPPLVIPVIEERAEVGRRVVDTGKGVLIHKRVNYREERVDQSLMQEELIVERVPVDRIVTGPEPTQHYEGETLVVPVLEEVLVLEKRIRVKEEVRITRRKRQVESPQSVELKSEEVSVERFDEGGVGGRHG
jgi:uncharacterized protein (TIGR02271 family)